MQGADYSTEKIASLFKNDAILDMDPPVTGNHPNLKFQSILALIPGNMLENESIAEIIRVSLALLVHLEAKSKATLLKDMSILLDYVMNEAGGRKKKKPNIEVVKWLNLLGPLLAIHENTTVDVPHVASNGEDRVSFSVAGADGSVIDIVIPRCNVRCLLFNFLSTPALQHIVRRYSVGCNQLLNLKRSFF
jgi:hypothetical protein